ncbi:ABC transporter ATP-binding protein [Telmatospirillum sp. J64-1]|uniref:ABC transporter ATP-binding protein n=1 Tax=Telmatospirillum sp. J64-1 TaxID=2502183 RepID=UPI00115F68D0|nr:ABC transporter ATP-binding protein [Telmatospirillum sp. J64-1]
MLEIKDVHFHYGQAHVLQGVDLAIGDEPLALIGRNGMGKTTLCHSIMGMARISRGSIRFQGTEIQGRRPDHIARSGIALVPQGRRVFPSLTVDEHLRLVAKGRNRPWTIERVYETFPRLAERKRNGGAQLSGGEQQMLAIARALLTNPRLVIMDEPSEGLAPVIVDHLCIVLRDLAKSGMGILLVEQNLGVATTVCDRVAVMVTGRIAATMPSQDLLEDETAQRRWLGVSAHA